MNPAAPEFDATEHNNNNQYYENDIFWHHSQAAAAAVAQMRIHAGYGDTFVVRFHADSSSSNIGGAAAAAVAEDSVYVVYDHFIQMYVVRGRMRNNMRPFSTFLPSRQTVASFILNIFLPGTLQMSLYSYANLPNDSRRIMFSTFTAPHMEREKITHYRFVHLPQSPDSSMRSNKAIKRFVDDMLDLLVRSKNQMDLDYNHLSAAAATTATNNNTPEANVVVSGW